MLVTTEDHGGGKQLVRFRVWPRAVAGLVVSGVLGTLAILSGLDGARAACIVLGVLGILAAARAYRETAAAMAEVRGAVDTLAEQLEPTPTLSPTNPEPVAPEGVATENVPSAA